VQQAAGFVGLDKSFYHKWSCKDETFVLCKYNKTDNLTYNNNNQPKSSFISLSFDHKPIHVLNYQSDLKTRGP
jgi:hypothetical protein